MTSLRRRGDTAISRRALNDARAKGHRLVLLVGDEPYYSRVGFEKVSKGRATMPAPSTTIAFWLPSSKGAPLTASPARSAPIGSTRAKRAGAFLHDFLLHHALAFHSSILGMSDDHDQLTDVAGYILAKKLAVLTSREVKQNVRTMKKLDKRTWESTLNQLESWGWLDVVPGPRPTSPPQGAINPMVHRKFDAKAKEEVARRKLVRETMVALGVKQAA